ncbi:class III extradiol ring-cleavage dioxygenase [Nocardia sp. NPDC019255]|uniref:DODA-type extradiol aromatic ring-opening family dioxygenase n=1 Tax=Nocardia sp. NPDC019255 TaxID=3154591 RepID=UPI0033C024B3
MPLVYDFWGFPERYYQVRYPAPGAPEPAESVRDLLRGPGVAVADVPERGLDHSAYVPLRQMYPDADVPVLQLSMPTLDPRALLDIGRKLAPLREQGVLIVGSGFFTHNLRAMTSDDEQAHSFTAEFDAWGGEALAAGDGGRAARFRAQGARRPPDPPACRALRTAVRRARRGRGGPRNAAHRHRRLLVRHGATIVQLG